MRGAGVIAVMAATAVLLGSGSASANAATSELRAAAAWQPAGNAKHKGKVRRVRILNAAQASILKRGLRVRIRARPRRRHGRTRHGRRNSGSLRVRVRARSRGLDGGKATRFTKRRKVRFTRHRRRTVRLRLTKAGREAIAGCPAHTIRARAGKRSSRRVRLELSSKLCPRKPIGPVGTIATPAPGPGSRPAASPGADKPSPRPACDPIGQQTGSLCLLPFPDDYYTVRDPSTQTGRRVNLETQAMPANADGVHVDARPYNASDGFSPGQPIVAKVPGLDDPAALARTDAAPINDLDRYAQADAPVVVLDAETGERWPIWAEIDSHATDTARTALQIHPATNLAAGHRYIVALRDLKTATGETIPAPEGFRRLRDSLPSGAPGIDGQRRRFESIFATLDEGGIERRDLYLAWDFTVASDLGIAARMLHIRDDAFAALGDSDLADLAVAGESPSFRVEGVTEFSPAEDPRVARQVRGSFTVPCYLEPSCAPGGRFALGADGLPRRNGDWVANFECIIPRVAVEGSPTPVRPAVYGHGLFGSAGEVAAGVQKELANTHGFILCATDEIGMSTGDLPNTLGILNDLSRFPELADRLQQGLLDELYLGRAMIHTDGLGSDPAFHVDGTLATRSVIDAERLYYDGNSQGGIMGGALTAVAPDFTRAALGVPAMRYSVLLPRSVDYDPFAAILRSNYPDQLAEPLLLSLMQMLWDRGEPNGYAHRMTDDPLPNTPAHEVLMNVAFGDHQVTNWAADVEARTIGASTHAPVLDPGRWPGVDELWDIPRIASYPFGGSAIIYWDIGPVRLDPADPGGTIGVPAPPIVNLPNREGEDPHGAPRGAPGGLRQVSDFLRPDGAVTDVCGPDPCYSGGWTGP